MTVAFGTSTPTSMTVVATSTSSSPARKRVITASFSRRRQPPVQQAEPEPGQLVGGQPLVRLLGAGHLELLALLDQRADHVGLVSCRDLGRGCPPMPAPPARARSRERVTIVWRAAGWQLVDDADVEVAVDGHRRACAGSASRS